MKHKIRTWLLLFILALFPFPAAGAFEEERIVPLPVNELEDVFSKWWRQAGFEVTRSSEEGKLRLVVSSGDTVGYFDISPRSAIAAKVIPTVANDTGVMFNAMEKWWQHLSLYIHGPTNQTVPIDSTFPSAVLSKIESVVCIRIVTGEEKDNLSGVIVDGAGLVVTTAHGIPEGQEMVLTFYDNSESRGVLLHRDVAQDLALIQIQGSAFEAVSPLNGRNLLGMGEQVFSIGCVGELQGTVTAGVINGPPRRVDNQPLWQVNMEILPGKSGSPVFDSQGNLVALVKGRYRGTSTVGFLIPLETMIHFLKESSPL